MPCSGRGASSSSPRFSGGCGGPELREHLVGLELAGAQELHPRRLLCPELAQSQLASWVVWIGYAHEQARRAVARPGALVEELHAPGAHEVHEQREVAGHVDDEVLADPPNARDRPAFERRQRRVERLERVDSGSERGLDLGAAQRRVEATRGDLDLGEFGHGLKATRAWPRASRTASIKE